MLTMSFPGHYSLTWRWQSSIGLAFTNIVRHIDIYLQEDQLTCIRFSFSFSSNLFAKSI